MVMIQFLTPSVKCLFVSQYIQQAVFHNENQFTLYDWEDISEVVNLMKNPNFSCLKLISIEYLLVSCHHLWLLLH